MSGKSYREHILGWESLKCLLWLVDEPREPADGSGFDVCPRFARAPHEGCPLAQWKPMDCRIKVEGSSAPENAEESRPPGSESP